MPQIPEKLIKFPKLEELKGKFGKDISIGVPSKSPIDLEIKTDSEPKDLNINIGGKIPGISGEINIQGPNFDMPKAKVELRGKPKINVGLPSFGKKSISLPENNPQLLRAILSAPVDAPINLNKKPNGLAKINDKLFCLGGKNYLIYVVCVEPVQLMQKIKLVDEKTLYSL